MNRRLSLSSERLTDLTPADLASVAGAAATLDCLAIPTQQCFTGYYPSINAPCTTLVEPVTRVITSTS